MWFSIGRRIVHVAVIVNLHTESFAGKVCSVPARRTYAILYPIAGVWMPGKANQDRHIHDEPELRLVERLPAENRFHTLKIAIPLRQDACI